MTPPDTERHHVIVDGRDCWLTDEEIRDSSPVAGDLEPTLEEQEKDLEALKQLAERRKIQPSRFDERSWEGVHPWLVERMRAQREARDRDFDRELRQDIARRARVVQRGRDLVSTLFAQIRQTPQAREAPRPRERGSRRPGSSSRDGPDDPSDDPDDVDGARGGWSL